MRLSAYIRVTSLFQEQVQESLVRLGREFNCEYTREERWDEVDLIWKPIIYGVDYLNIPKLKAFNNFLTSHMTLTEKISLVRTGLKVMGSERFFELHPATAVAPEIPIYPNLEGLGKSGWIVKPSKGFGGKEIEVFWDLRDLRRLILDPENPKVIQKYIERPLLLNDYKFDIRVHILLMADRILYHDFCYVRAAPCKYIPRGKSTRVHLTNLALHRYDGKLYPFEVLLPLGINLTTIVTFLTQIKPLFIAAQETERAFREEKGVHFSTFELLGVDMMFDRTGKPWLLEINKDPAFKSEGFYAESGPQLIDDTLKEVFFFELFPEKREATHFHELT